jgi:hypothetical protein
MAPRWAAYRKTLVRFAPLTRRQKAAPSAPTVNVNEQSSRVLVETGPAALDSSPANLRVAIEGVDGSG